MQYEASILYWQERCRERSILPDDSKDRSGMLGQKDTPCRRTSRKMKTERVEPPCSSHLRRVCEAEGRVRGAALRRAEPERI